MIKQFIARHYVTAIGVVVGMVAGFLYWRFVGCTSGHCPITGSPVNSTLYGGVLGGLLFSMFKPQNKKSDATDSSNK
jgi:hypothetical protein